VTTARTVMVSVYAMAYTVAVYAGTSALQSGDGLYAAGLLGTSIGLLLGMHREFGHAARLLRVVAVYRHGAPYAGPVDDLAAIEQATALPPGCRCETWWTSLGRDHALHCPALAWKDTRRTRPHPPRPRRRELTPSSPGSSPSSATRTGASPRSTGRSCRRPTTP
jgi:hypothetical protein